MAEWTGTQDQCHGERKERIKVPLLLQGIFEICCCFVTMHPFMSSNFWCFFSKDFTRLNIKTNKTTPCPFQTPSEPKTTTATPTFLADLAVQCLTPCPSAPFMKSSLRRAASSVAVGLCIDLLRVMPGACEHFHQCCLFYLPLLLC